MLRPDALVFWTVFLSFVGWGIYRKMTHMVNPYRAFFSVTIIPVSLLCFISSMTLLAKAATYGGEELRLAMMEFSPETLVVVATCFVMSGPFFWYFLLRYWSRRALHARKVREALTSGAQPSNLP